MSQHYPIPKGSSPSNQCKCGMWVYMVPTSKGKRMPVSVDAPGCETPTAFKDGVGIPHWDNCPHAEDFRRQTEPAQPKQEQGPRWEQGALW